jgi:hypothetical protein
MKINIFYICGIQQPKKLILTDKEHLAKAVSLGFSEISH